MNDIKWRDFSDENLILLEKYPNNPIIVQTEISIRTGWAYQIGFKYGKPYMNCFLEHVTAFAFFQNPSN